MPGKTECVRSISVSNWVSTVSGERLPKNAATVLV